MSAAAGPSTSSWFAEPFGVSFYQVDALGVVFNMWYLAYCDQAQTAFFADLAARTPGLPTWRELGLDVLLRSADVEWLGSLGPGDRGRALVASERVGRTSLRLRYVLERTHGPDGPLKVPQVAFTASIGYVCVQVDGLRPAAVPGPWRDALALADISTSR